MKKKLPKKRGNLVKSIDWILCLVADSEAAGERNIFDLIQEAVEGGATIVQLRGKNWNTREFLEMSIKSAEFLRKKDIPLIINDRIDIALACEASGVHLGQEDMPLPFARNLLGKRKIIGISVSNVEEAVRAEAGGADYIGVGPIFLTLSKKTVTPALGPEGLKKIREKVKIPILAIGGVNVGNAREVIEAGADGIAVISAILGYRNARKAAAELLKAIAHNASFTRE